MAHFILTICCPRSMAKFILWVSFNFSTLTVNMKLTMIIHNRSPLTNKVSKKIDLKRPSSTKTVKHLELLRFHFPSLRWIICVFSPDRWKKEKETQNITLRCTRFQLKLIVYDYIQPKCAFNLSYMVFLDKISLVLKNLIENLVYIQWKN